VVPDGLLEELPAAEGAVEDLSPAHLHLADGQPIGEARRVVRGGQRQRQSRQPAGEERLDVRGAQVVADGLQRRGVGGAEEPVVPRREGAASALEVSLDPLVAVQAQLDRVGGVATDLEEGRPHSGSIREK